MGQYSNLSRSDLYSQEEIVLLEQDAAAPPFHEDADLAALREWHEWTVEPPVFEEAPEQDAVLYVRDHADGYRKFWQGLSETYCANAAERDGYRAAVEEAGAVMLQTRITRKVATAEDKLADAETNAYLAQRWAEIDEYNTVRESMTW